MNKIFQRKFPLRLFSQFKKKPLEFDIFDFQYNKVIAEKEKHWEGLTREEVLGMDNLGYESPRYREANRQMWVGIGIGFILLCSYAYSFHLENTLFEQTYQDYKEREYQAARSQFVKNKQSFKYQ